MRIKHRAERNESADQAKTGEQLPERDRSRLGQSLAHHVVFEIGRAAAIFRQLSRLTTTGNIL